MTLFLFKSWRRQSATCSLFILLVLPASTNYQLRDFAFGSGGGDDGQSANYATLQILGEPGSFSLAASANNQLGSGLIFANQAAIQAPTLANDANYYNKLKLTLNPGSNASDTAYAIAISSDDFATTNYVQNDNTVGATLGSEDWQTYASWGGAPGFFVLGLNSNTTYKVKVKTRQGDFTETAWGPTASAATVDVQISFSVAGVASGTSVAGVTTDVTTTATSVPFGELTRNVRQEAAQTLTVSTNSSSGYTTSVRQMGSLVNDQNSTFPTVTGTNAAPSVWPTEIQTGAYGYHTTDSSLGTDTTTRFSTDNTFAQFASTAQEIAYSAGPVTNEATSIVFAIEAGKAQVPGDYIHTITYTIYGRF